ncbi:hypothetical protein SZ64_07360 [Erythrobacter sp. SG61-1L]|uniref:hypothetical protein n=1 Tax=Erythrobacter sp. SG61-1L TaxID=1603897 RepID=UPI0006C90EEB|nr:hypothetical protein [Erythrobacter sp. SG61-1L]KPL67952.1 hypothetical protein SZ64_07360 [Erythrobacter sp. SG61-1L]
MRLRPTAILATLLAAGFAAPLLAVEPPPPETFPMEPADDAAAFAAAGFKLTNGDWHGCDDPGTAAYAPGQIEQVADFNGDGQPEAVITESSSFCYGFTGQGYFLVSRNASGQWKLMDQGIGILRALEARGAGNWPDLEVGCPGFCFPVLRWNGSTYEPHRNEYEGKACTP